MARNKASLPTVVLIWIESRIVVFYKWHLRDDCLSCVQMVFLPSLDEPHLLADAPTDTTHNCHICGKPFTGRNWKQNLQYHMYKHSGLKPYKCPFCEHCASLKFNLARHIRRKHPEADVVGGGSSNDNPFVAQSFSSTEHQSCGSSYQPI